MKVVLYAVKMGASCKSFISVAWEVDEIYWSGRTERMIRVGDLLPLGIAERARDLLEEKWSGSGSGSGSGSVSRKMKGEPVPDWVEEMRWAVQDRDPLEPGS